MSAEKETILSQVTHVVNETNEEGQVVAPAVRYLTMQERIDREKELKALDDTLTQPNWVLSRMELTHDRMNSMRQRRARLKKEISTYSPPTDLRGETKDALYKLEKDLAAKIQEGMVPREDMTRNPVGAVDQNIKWGVAKKSAILTWKNIKRLLSPDSEEKDLANIEQLRPSRYRGNGNAVYLPDAEAPSSFAMTPLAKENFEDVFPDSPTVDTPLKQAERREAEDARIAELQAQVAELERKLSVKKADHYVKKRARQMATAEASVRMKKWWADKKAKQVVGQIVEDAKLGG